MSDVLDWKVGMFIRTTNPFLGNLKIVKLFENTLWLEMSNGDILKGVKYHEIY